MLAQILNSLKRRRIGLCLNPPENAIVLSIDEKTGIQALERPNCYQRLRLDEFQPNCQRYDLCSAWNSKLAPRFRGCDRRCSLNDF